jgi:cytoskeletal protein CcmA (bactofilin family)
VVLFYVSGTLDGIFSDNINIKETVEGDISGDISGTVWGDISGTISGHVAKGNINTQYNGLLDGELNGKVTADISGDICGDLNGDICGTVDISYLTGALLLNDISADFSGTIINGMIDGVSVSGSYSGPVISQLEANIDNATLKGFVNGMYSGKIDGTVDIYYSGDINGTISSDVSGEICIYVTNMTVNGQSESTINNADDINILFNGTLSGEITKEDISSCSCVKSNAITVKIGKPSIGGGIYEYNVIESEIEYMRRERQQCFVSNALSNGKTQFKTALDLLQVSKYQCNGST